MRLHTIIVSTRPGRIGPAIARWFHDFAVEHGKFDAHLVDLADFNLPIFDEPHHPLQQRYEHAHTKKWSASVAEADAFAFVLPEYNYSPPPSFVNAVDYLHREWHYKPAGFVSYGGVSGGLRSAQAARLMVTTVKMMPVPEGVILPAAVQQIKDGVFMANDFNTQGAAAMLDEMLRWTQALAGLRKEGR